MKWILPLIGALTAYITTLYLGLVIWIRLGLPIGPYSVLPTVIGTYMIAVGVKAMREATKLHGGAKRYFESENRTLAYALCRFGLKKTRCKEYWRGTISLITTGYYGITRHPAYSGALLATTGLAFILGFPLISTIILYTWLYLVTVIEEAELEERTGEYARYKSKTPRLAPFKLLIVETRKAINYAKRRLR